MNEKRGPKPKETYSCICCQRIFKDSISKCKHEFYMKSKSKKGTCGSQAAHSTNGSILGTKDTKMEDAEFDMPNNKQQQVQNFGVYNQPTANEFVSLAKSFLKTGLGSKPAEQQKLSLMLKGSAVDKIQQSSTSKASTTDSIKEVLEATDGWRMAVKTYESDEFNDLPKLTEDYAKSFLLLGGNYGCQNSEFPVALSKVVGFFSAQRIPTCLLPPYLHFFKGFNPTEDNNSSLKGLLTLAKKINADMTWVARLQKPMGLLVESAWLETDQQITVASILCCQRKFFSAHYFDVIEQVVKAPFTSKCLVNTLDNFFDFFGQQCDNYVDEDIMLAYAGLDNRYNINTLKKQLEELQIEAKRSFGNVQLIPLLKLANTKNYEAIKMMVRTLPEDATAEDMAAFLEDIEGKLQDKEILNKQREELKQSEVQRLQEKQLKEEKEKTRLKTEEEEKKKLLQIKEQEQKQQYEATCLQVYHEFSSLNNMLADDQSFTKFAEQITEIATEINIVPRPEQLAAMFLMLTSTHQRTLMQRPTGTGKSLMFGLMSRYMNVIYGHKTVVAVPNEVLAAMQQKKYAPWSSKDIDDLYIDNFLSNYCTHSDVLTGNIPFGTRIFIDEIDSLFFSDAPTIIKNRFLSAILLMNKYKLIGMTATFRGERGLNKMKAFLNDTVVIKAEATERKLQLTVFGKLKSDEIDLKVIEVGKQKQQELPVIVILPSINKCEEMKQHFQHCTIFGKGRVFEQMNCLEELSKISNAPWPVILTTPEASLGHDLASIAYVIQVTVPESFSEFIQNAGRSNRIDPNAPLIGALITTADVSNINSVKQGCEFEQQRQRLFRADYLQCLQYLECCCLVDSSLSTFKSAFKLFQRSASAAEIYKILTKAPKFKVALEVAGLTQPCDNAVEVLPISKASAPNRKVDIIVVPKILRDKNIKQPEEEFGMLGKRVTRSKKCVNDFSQDSANSYCSSSNEAQHFKRVRQDQRKIQMNAFVVEQPLDKEEDELISDELAGYMSDLRQNNQNKEAKDVQQLHFEQYNPKNSQLKEGVLKEKELEEARTVFAKYGFAVPEPAAKNNKSRTGSEILFGAKGISNKKRETKTVDQGDDRMSVVSGKTDKTSNSGRFKVKYKVGDRTISGAIIKEVRAEDWKFVRKDQKGNSYFECVQCSKEMRNDNRRTHVCV